MYELVGKTVKAIRVNQDQSIMAFDTDDGEVAYETYGDCCSETWFADIIGTNALLGAVVKSVDEVDMDGYNTDDGRCLQQYDTAYGYKITTDKGYADIVFRNSSNGYYGGWIDLVVGKAKGTFTFITEDWRA